MPHKDEEARKQYRKAYYQKNREKLLQQRKEHYENNKEELLQQRKEHYENNRDKKIQYKRKYYEENRDKLLQQQKEYNKSKGAIKEKLKHCKENDVKYNREFDIDEDYVNELLKKQNNTCNNCNIKMKLEWEDAYDKEQFSINRLDNSIGHIKTNCEITCWGCNDYLGKLDKRTC